ncbi:MAG TPA: phospholipase [Pilimelia sp.]|nr:phospholipase [Pilimelia sp.]
MSGHSRIPRFTATLSVALLALGAPPAAAAAPVSTGSVAQYTDVLLYETALPAFSDIRAQRPRPTELDWTSDGCSWSPDRPVGYDFLPGCHRHDFGYRNYKRQRRFRADTRRKLDDTMRRDHYGTCGHDAACRRLADLYYEAVRQFGGPRFAAAHDALTSEIARQEAARRTASA